MIFGRTGALLFLRVLHLLAAVIWLGPTYSTFLSPPPKSVTKSNRRAEATTQRAAATLMLLSGAIYIALNLQLSFRSGWGVFTLAGSALGLLMWINTCFLEGTKIGTKPLSAGAANMTLSFPAFVFMASASHLGLTLAPDRSLPLLCVEVFVSMLAAELLLLHPKSPVAKYRIRVLLCSATLTLGLYLIISL